MKTQKVRRRTYKTDYKIRINMLKSEKPRIIFRKTNRYILAQYIQSNESKDKVIIGTTSKELLEYGWPKEFSGSLKSISASYLTGFLFGKKIREKKFQDAIIDMGMVRKIHKSKPFAFIKGVIDAGIKIECKKEVFPEEDRIQGKNLKEDFSKYFNNIKSKIEGNKK